MNRLIDATASAALLIVATVLLFVPESRAAPLRVVNQVLFFIVGAPSIWRYWKAGILTKTPAQIYAMPSRPKESFLSFVAMLMGMVAIMVAG